MVPDVTAEAWTAWIGFDTLDHEVIWHSLCLTARDCANMAHECRVLGLHDRAEMLERRARAYEAATFALGRSGESDGG